MSDPVETPFGRRLRLCAAALPSTTRVAAKRVLAFVVLIVAARAPAQPPADPPTRRPIGEDTHAFRLVLSRTRLRPLQSVDELLDRPANKILIVLGRTDVIDKSKLNQLGGQTFMNIINKVNSLLTTPAIIAMNKAVAIDKQPAASVAKSFLKANGLI